MPCCGAAPKQGRKPCVSFGIVLIVHGVILFSSFILHVVIGGVFDSAILEKVTIRSQADAIERNKIAGDDDTHATSTVYVYSITNEAAVVAGAVPIFESVGPFIYKTKVGQVDTNLDPANGEVTYYARINQEFVQAGSADLDQIITNIDPTYAGVFGANEPTLTESGLMLAQALAMVGAIDASMADYIVPTYFGARSATFPGGDAAFYPSLYANVTANFHSNETIVNNKDLLYAQWGGAAMIADGVSLMGSDAGKAGVSTSATARGIIAGGMLGVTYLTDAQKANITDAFSSDASFYGLGIYQIMRIVGSDCSPLTIAEVAAIMTCYYSPECGLAAIGMMLADTGDNSYNTQAYSMWGLDFSNPTHQCYASALMSYPTMMMPLATHFFRDRLLAEKGGVTDNILEKKTARAIIEGYHSPAINSLGAPAWLPGLYFNHTTEAGARAGGMTYKVDGGSIDSSKLNHLKEYMGVTGFDYNGDGVLKSFTDSPECMDGSNVYPPNQKKMEFTSLKSQYEVFDSSLYKSCSFKENEVRVYTMGNYNAPIFVRDDLACYALDVARATTPGYQSIRHVSGANLYMTPACMHMYPDQKMWIDDCPVTTPEEHGTSTAIDPLSGLPWMLQQNGQVVMGFDVSTSAFDITGVNTSNRFPSFRTKTVMELAAKDKDQILTTYDLMYLLKDTLSFVGLGIGLFFIVVGAILIKSSVQSVGKTVPIDASGAPVKA